MARVKCSYCDKPAVITLRYAGRNYCKSHFSRLMWKRFKRTVRNNKLFKEGQKVGVALSGGKDSTVLLHLLTRIRKPLKLELTGITINEGIKEHRRRNLSLIRELCNELGVNLEVVSFEDAFGHTIDDIARKQKNRPPCYYCGVLRRYLLNKTVRELGLDVLATGHNLDDEAQSILMNLMRGNHSKLYRIGAMVGVRKYSQFVPRVKPLRDSPEREIGVYALIHGLKADLKTECPYVRRSFRDALRKHLNELEDKFPGTKIAIVRTFDQFLHSSAQDFPPPHPCPKCGELTSSEVCKACKILGEIGVSS